INRILATSLLIRGFPPLRNEPLLANSVRQQLAQKAIGELIDTNLVIFGRGTLVTLTDPNSHDVIDQATANLSPTTNSTADGASNPDSNAHSDPEPNSIKVRDASSDYVGGDVRHYGQHADPDGSDNHE
ncbi:MAG: hypothetical protein H0V25_01460, partial [Solirubrobacterales bacterium]|nr:hypothetical protein [Solirubrobacterales bacterium]